MKGTILSFRQGKKTQRPRHFVVEVEGIESKEKARTLVGKKVVWKSPAGKVHEGFISSIHGNKGHIRVFFEPGKSLPGQAINQEVEVK